MGIKALLVGGNKDNFRTAEINGEDVKFYPVRVAAMLQAESVVTEIARAVSCMFDPNGEQYTKRTLLTEQDKESGAIISSSIEEPISPVHAKERLKRRGDSIASIAESLLSEGNAKKMAVLVIDSLRDDELTVDDILALDTAMFIHLAKETVLAAMPDMAPFLTAASKKMGSVLSVDAEPDEPDVEIKIAE